MVIPISHFCCSASDHIILTKSFLNSSDDQINMYVRSVCGISVLLGKLISILSVYYILYVKKQLQRSWIHEAVRPLVHQVQYYLLQWPPTWWPWAWWYPWMGFLVPACFFNKASLPQNKELILVFLYLNGAGILPKNSRRITFGSTGTHLAAFIIRLMLGFQPLNILWLVPESYDVLQLLCGSHFVAVPTLHPQISKVPTSSATLENRATSSVLGNSWRLGGRNGEGRGWREDLSKKKCLRVHPPKTPFSLGELTSLAWRSVVIVGPFSK